MSFAATDALTGDYELLRSGCGLLDRSERGKLALTGPEAAEFLNGQVTNDVLALGPGRGCYAALLTHKGKMLADLRVLATAGGAGAGVELLLDTERTALQALFDAIRLHMVGYQVELHKRTLESGLLSLIGPGARQAASQAAGYAELPLASEEHANVSAEIDGAAVVLATTDLGVDVICDASDLATVSAALQAADARPVSESAADVLRVEHGRPRFGLDLDESTIPQEAGLNERAVSFTKGCYVGQETVARLFYKGKPNRHLRGLRFEGGADAPPPVAGDAPAPRTGDELLLGDRAVGHLGSVVWSPRQGTIGLALVRREAAPGDELLVGPGAIRARVVELPFAD